MKIVEVADNLRTMTIGDYLETIAKKNNMDISSGTFGVSLVPESDDKVFKLWMVDHAYEKWIDYCFSHQGQRCIPNIFSKRIRRLSNIFIRHKSTHNKINYITMEKLYKIDYSENVELSNGKHISYEKMFEHLHNTVALQIADTSIQKQYDAMLETAIELAKTNDLDLKTKNNIMLRKNGDMVFTDPVCDFRDESIYNKLPSALRPDLFNAVSGRMGAIAKISIDGLLAKPRAEQLKYFISFLQNKQSLRSSELITIYEKSLFCFIQYMIACGSTDKTAHTHDVLYNIVPKVLGIALASGDDIYFKVISAIDNKFEEIYGKQNNITGYCGLYCNLAYLSFAELNRYVQYIMRRKDSARIFAIAKSIYFEKLPTDLAKNVTDYILQF